MAHAKRPLRIEPDRKTPRALISVPLSPADLAVIDRAAKRAKLSRSRFIREAALRATTVATEAA